MWCDALQIDRVPEFENFRTEDIIFGEPKDGELPDGQEFLKIPISYQHSDEEVGPLAIVNDLCFSFGVKG